MEECTTYRLPKDPVKNLLPTPSYCWKPEGVDKSLMNARLEVSDPGKILLLSESLFDCNIHDLEKKFNYYIQTETEAAVVFLITLECLSHEAVIYVINQDSLPLVFRMPAQHQLFKEILNQKTSILHSFEDYEENLRKILKPYISAKQRRKAEIVTIPIVSKLKTGQEFAIPKLISIVNSPKTQEFITKLVNETCRFCLPVMLNTTKLEEEERTKKQCQSLLHVARKLFWHLGDLSDLLKEIMSEARRITKAERCSLFLLDPDHIHLVAQVFDGIVQDKLATEVKIAKDQGIAGHVAATGKLLNIKDAYKHPLFYKGMDEATGFRTKNILCFPIRDETGIVGVAQLCNKTHGDFDFFDEEAALAFSLYCGLSIMHSLMYKNLREAQSRTKLSSELMLYHMKVTDDDIKQVLLCTNRHAYLDFDMFKFSPKRVHTTEVPCQVLRIFEDLKLFQHFRIKREKLVKFVLHAQKGYRDIPYHNWMHAFSTFHFAYVSIKQLKLLENKDITFLEGMALLIACMCHDIDHRGTTNSFQLQTDSVIASLYSSVGSVMEHHHVSQTLCILNNEECNFLDGLNQNDYISFLAMIRDLILATDMANHFILKNQQEALVTNGYNCSDAEDKKAFINLLMTCSDISDQIKHWGVIKLVTQQVYNEFFHQGDMEKSLGKKPVIMMDRDQANIPELQISFLNMVCLPAFKILDGLYPDVVDFESILNLHISCWEACIPVYTTYLKKNIKPLEILLYPEIDGEVEKIIGKETLQKINSESLDPDGEE